MYESSIATEITIALCLFLDLERPLFYQQCNPCDVKTQNWLDTAWQEYRPHNDVPPTYTQNEKAGDGGGGEGG